MDTGGGDVYAGPTKDACLAAMKKDSDDFEPSDAFEIEGSTKIRVTDENDDLTGELTTLDEEYVADAIDGAYCIATENC